MTRYDFDQLHDRKNTSSIKYDAAPLLGKKEGLFPLWVADMDFPTAQPVIDTLVERAKNGIFGYEFASPAYFAAVQGWMFDHFGWEADLKWIVRTPGVVAALATAVRAFTKPGDAVLVQPPVYYPFFSDVTQNGRTLVTSPLVYEDGRYRMDFDDFERTITDNGVKLFLLCNPHNPVGRAWTRGELERVAEICGRHGVIVASDEIHEDFARPGHEHVVYASVSESAARSCIVCTAPSKTFNLAGLQTSNVFIPNPTLRKRFKAEYKSGGLDEANAFGLVAAQAAYEHGADWLAQLKSYLEDNLAFVREFLDTRLPMLKLVEPESTYLLWIDCSALGLNDDELQRLIEDEAGLWLDMGTMFGEGGSGFVRVNIACPRSTLEQAFAALARALPSQK
ncbi:MAG: MalY/PatB family protein [Coriobacteriales bacterium]|nr:MalY/PatB family protein [Coriobacteriales bacterium]